MLNILVPLVWNSALHFFDNLSHCHAENYKNGLGKFEVNDFFICLNRLAKVASAIEMEILVPKSGYKIRNTGYGGTE